MTDRIYITEEEHVALIKESDWNRPVTSAFGGNRVWLTDTEAGHWALVRLAEMRGLDEPLSP